MASACKIGKVKRITIRAPPLGASLMSSGGSLGAAWWQPKMKRAAFAAFLVGVSGGDKGDRTPDLVNAIHALSQLSYIPVDRAPVLQIGEVRVKRGWRRG